MTETNLVDIIVDKTFIMYADTLPGIVRSNSVPMLMESNVKTKGKRRHSLQMDDFLALCDTDTGSSEGVSLSQSSSYRKNWDEYSVDGVLTPLELPSTPRDYCDSVIDAADAPERMDTIIACYDDTPNMVVSPQTPRDGDEHIPLVDYQIDMPMTCVPYAQSTDGMAPVLTQVPWVPHVENGCYWAQADNNWPANEAGNDSNNWSANEADNADWSVNEGDNNWSANEGDHNNDNNWSGSDHQGTYYGYPPIAANHPAPLGRQYSAQSNHTETTRAETVTSTAALMQKKSRKRRSRWAYENRKNRVTLLVDPNNEEPVEECIERLIGWNGGHIKYVTECYEGSFVKVEKAYPGLMSVQISAPFVESFLKCRERMLGWVHAVFPHAHVSESDEGMTIKSFSMQTRRASAPVLGGTVGLMQTFEANSLPAQATKRRSRHRRHSQ